MSERGSFVTQYIYCTKCYEGVRDLLMRDRGKFLCASLIEGWDASTGIESEKYLPIIAGKVGGHYAGEEVDAMMDILETEGIANAICHTVRISVLPDDASADTVLVFRPAVQSEAERTREVFLAERRS